MTLRHIIPAISRNAVPEPNDPRFSVVPDFDDGSLELDLAETIHDLLRERGVKRAVEVGTSKGTGAIYWADAIGEDGHLWTCEFKPELLFGAIQRWHALGLAGRITGICGDANLPETWQDVPDDVDFVLFDCQHHTLGALQEYACLMYKIKPGALLIWHDTIYPSERAAVDLIATMRGKDLSKDLISLPSCRGCLAMEA